MQTREINGVIWYLQQQERVNGVLYEQWRRYEHSAQDLELVGGEVQRKARALPGVWGPPAA